MKAKPFKATSVPDLVGKKASDTITRAELVSLIVSRVPPRPHDDDATARNRVSGKVSYHVRISGTLKEASPGNFALGAISGWLRQGWPGHFDDVPRAPRIVTARVSVGEGSDTAKVTVRGLVLPGDIARCHAAITRMENNIVALEREVERLRSCLASSQAETRALEPDATRWRDWNRKKGRKRNS